ncbi:hypothetical protein [Myxococcus sp. AS-1-15]|uniref:hypothetical protein n=1 Tax=Myxococcus sp. AS-1-15 TaxID=2874600 RepID=UPI001CBEA5C5|nr:hypothetical protein [Myxococcus sp. AS-1-15]MBZ4402426.1 hypothetical protein [Myxococcus sp. AS-1-15]
MDTAQREALSHRLVVTEAGYAEAVSRMDGSLGARTRLATARERYRAAEEAAIEVLGAGEALELVETLHERFHSRAAGAPSSPTHTMPPRAASLPMLRR